MTFEPLILVPSAAFAFAVPLIEILRSAPQVLVVIAAEPSKSVSLIFTAEANFEAVEALPKKLSAKILLHFLFAAPIVAEVFSGKIESIKVLLPAIIWLSLVIKPATTSSPAGGIVIVYDDLYCNVKLRLNRILHLSIY